MRGFALKPFTFHTVLCNSWHTRRKPGWYCLFNWRKLSYRLEYVADATIWVDCRQFRHRDVNKNSAVNLLKHNPRCVRSEIVACTCDRRNLSGFKSSSIQFLYLLKQFFHCSVVCVAQTSFSASLQPLRASNIFRSCLINFWQEEIVFEGSQTLLTTLRLWQKMRLEPH
jgi:hypothetical protein